MRPLVLTLVLGLASAAVQGNFQPPNSGILQERTLGLDEILGDISSGGLLGLKAQKIAFLCKLVDKAESIAGFVGGLKLESHLKKKLEFFLKDKCKKTTQTQPPPSTSVPPPESQTSPSTTSSPPETSSPSTPPPETKTTPPETKTTPPETKTTPPETKTSPPPETTPPKETTPTPETTPPKETSPPAPPPTETTPTPETTPPKETPPPPATTPETETSPPPGTTPPEETSPPTPPKETTPAIPGTPPKETSPPPGTTPPNETTPTPETTPPNETSPPPDTTPPKGPESSFITKTTPNNSPPPVTLPPPTPTTTAPPTTLTITECIDVTTAIPPCATGCFSSAGSQVGCSDKDFGCFCKPGSQEQLSMLVQQCVSTACPPESATSVSMGVSSVCSCFPNPPVPTNTGVPPTPCTPGSGDDCTQTKPQPEPTTPGVPPGCTGGEGDCSASPPKPGVTTTPSQGMPCPIVNGTGIDCTRPTSPPVVTAAADRFSFGLAECVLGGAAWLALAL